MHQLWKEREGEKIERGEKSERGRERGREIDREREIGEKGEERREREKKRERGEVGNHMTPHLKHTHFRGQIRGILLRQAASYLTCQTQSVHWRKIGPSSFDLPERECRCWKGCPYHTHSFWTNTCPVEKRKVPG